MLRKIRPSVWFSVIVLSAFLVGYLSWAKATFNWPFDDTFTAIQRPIVIPPSPLQGEGGGEVDLGGWKTYRNEEYGFEFMYPEDWHEFPGQPRVVDLRNIQEIISFSNKQELLIFGVDGSVIEGDPNNYYSIRIIVAKKDFPDLSSYVLSLQAPGATNPGTSLTVDGRTAFSLGSTLYVEGPNNMIIHFSHSEAMPSGYVQRPELFDQILSTFRFIE